MDDENAYQALARAGENEGARWAFGTGFDNPLSDVDSAMPESVSAQDLATYCVMLGDDALVLSQQLSEWVAWAPELEDELALANIALDLLGQARLLLSRGAQVEGSDRGEDALAYFRDEREFRNVRLAEVPNGDFAQSCARLLIFSTWRLALFQRLTASRDPVLAAVAAKGVKELRYHRDYAARWVVCLGDGTEVSHDRVRKGVETVWPLVDELFANHAIDRAMADGSVAVEPAILRPEFDAVVTQVFEAATLPQPTVPAMGAVASRSGRDGVHTEHLGHVLAEMQSLARAHPEARW